MKEIIIKFQNNRTLFSTIQFILFIVLTTILIILIVKNIHLMNFALMQQFWWVSLLVVILAVLFISLKSLMLYLLVKDQLQKSYFHFVKVFCASFFFELTTFSGKIGADGFKYYLWKEIPAKERILTLIRIRSADIVGFLLLLSWFLLPVWLVVLFLLLIVFTFFRYRKSKKTHSFSIFSYKLNSLLQDKSLKWVLVVLLSAIAYLIMLAQFSLIFRVFGLELTAQNAKIFLLSHGLGALSQLPFGLGVKDFSLFYQLQGTLTAGDILLGIVWMRLGTELVSVLLGSIFVARYLKRKGIKRP